MHVHSLRQVLHFRVMARESAVTQLVENHLRSFMKRVTIVVVSSGVENAITLHRRNGQVLTTVARARVRARLSLLPRSLSFSVLSTAPTRTRCGPTAGSRRYPICGRSRTLATKKRFGTCPRSRCSTHARRLVHWTPLLNTPLLNTRAHLKVKSQLKP